MFYTQSCSRDNVVDCFVHDKTEGTHVCAHACRVRNIEKFDVFGPEYPVFQFFGFVIYVSANRAVSQSRICQFIDFEEAFTSVYTYRFSCVYTINVKLLFFHNVDGI